MACETRLKPRQTISQRADEVRKMVQRLVDGLTSGRVRVVINKITGAVAFDGLSDQDRDGVTDACAYRRLMTTGSALARAKIAAAEAIAGRTVDRKTVAQGHHSHDGGKTWHHH